MSKYALCSICTKPEVIKKKHIFQPYIIEENETMTFNQTRAQCSKQSHKQW